MTVFNSADTANFCVFFMVLKIDIHVQTTVVYKLTSLCLSLECQNRSAVRVTGKLSKRMIYATVARTANLAVSLSSTTSTVLKVEEKLPRVVCFSNNM